MLDMSGNRPKPRQDPKGTEYTGKTIRSTAQVLQAKGQKVARRRAFGTIYQARSGRYVARYPHPYEPYTANGSPNRVTAPSSFRTRAEAQSWLSAVQTDISRGLWKSPEQLEAEREAAKRAALIEARTFGPYAVDWLAARRLTPATHTGYEANLRVHLMPQWGETPIRDITTPAVRAWLAVLAPSRPGARKKAFELFRTILNSAVDDEIIAVNPCKRNMLNTVAAATSPDAPSKRQRKPRALTIDQLKTAAANVPAYMRALVLLSGMVGLRAGEARALRGRHLIDRGRHGLFLQIEEAYTGQGSKLKRGTPKTDKSVRDVPVPPALADDIRVAAQTAGPDGLLFPGIAGPSHVIPLSTYQNALRRLERKTDIGYLTPHDLRHTASSLLQASGVSQQVTADMLGHTKTVMTQIYTHTHPEQLQAAVAALSTVYDGVPADVTSLDQRRASNE